MAALRLPVGLLVFVDRGLEDARPRLDDLHAQDPGAAVEVDAFGLEGAGAGAPLGDRTEVGHLAGHTGIAFLGLPPATPHIKEGTLRALAVTSAKRSPLFPDIPTMAESGIRDQESELIIGVVVPAATPKPIVDLLQSQVARIVALPDVKEKLDTLGFSPVASTPEAYGAQIKSDIETWSKVVRDANIKVE